MTELFDIPESLSPKLVWLKKQGLVTSYHAEYADGGESPETGEDIYPWTCSQQHPPAHGTISQGIIGVGRNETDAILDYCKRTGLVHYSIE